MAAVLPYMHGRLLPFISAVLRLLWNVPCRSIPLVAAVRTSPANREAGQAIIFVYGSPEGTSNRDHAFAEFTDSLKSYMCRSIGDIARSLEASFVSIKFKIMSMQIFILLQPLAFMLI